MKLGGGGAMSIAQRLRNPGTGGGPAPRFKCIDLPSRQERKKRVRYWRGQPDGKNVLPWISLNPSGKNDDGRGQTGLAVAGFAWRWGFDGVAVYNVYPFPSPYPEDIEKLLAQADARDDREPRNAIEANHDYVAADLRGADAVVVAWGASGSRAFRADTRRLASQLLRKIRKINSSGISNLGAWCLGTTKRDGSPIHPLCKPSGLRPVPFSL